MDLKMQAYLDQLMQPVGGGAGMLDITTENAMNDKRMQRSNDEYAQNPERADLAMQRMAEYKAKSKDPFGIMEIIASLRKK